MNPLRIAAQAVQLVCDLFAPVQPVRVITGQHAQKPRHDARLLGFRDGSLAPEVWATMPQQSSAGSTASEAGVDLVAEEVPTPGAAHTPGVGHPSSPESLAHPNWRLGFWCYNHNATAERCECPLVQKKAAATDPPKVTTHLLLSAAIGLREFADSDACETPTYWRNIADQLDPK